MLVSSQIYELSDQRNWEIKVRKVKLQYNDAMQRFFSKTSNSYQKTAIRNYAR